MSGPDEFFATMKEIIVTPKEETISANSFAGFLHRLDSSNTGSSIIAQNARCQDIWQSEHPHLTQL